MDKTMNPNISVVIPIYNSESILPKLITRLTKSLQGICTNYEILLINDGSQDESWDSIQKIIDKNMQVRGVNLRRNYGQHNALLCGIRLAQYDVIITMDDDLQHPPEEIHKLVQKLNEGYDVVYGIPAKLVHSN